MAEQNNGNTISKANPQVRQRSISYPRYSLQQAERLARKVLDEGARHCDNDRVARGTGYTNARNGAYVALKATAGQFGMVMSAGGFISLSEPWIQALTSDDPEQLKRVRQDAMQQPELYRQLIEEYRDKQIPSPEKLGQQLYINQRYGIIKEASLGAAQLFIESASYAGMIDAKGFLRIGNQPSDPTNHQGDPTNYQETSDLKQGTIEVPNDPPRKNVLQDVPLEQSFVDTSGLDKHEMRLRNGKKAYLFVPVPLPKGEKERLKALIDLLLEEEGSVLS